MILRETKCAISTQFLGVSPMCGVKITLGMPHNSDKRLIVAFGSSENINGSTFFFSVFQVSQ
jgi:hypothetical protein